MRWPALAPLVAASACNWAFDLKPTVQVDASPDSPDAPPSIRDQLVWGITATDNTGAPLPPVYKGIGSESTRSAIPTIMVGPPLGGTALVAAEYDVTDGSFPIPYTLREAPHRIVYTLPGETVTHEIQWSISGAMLVVPRTTTYDAPVVPSGAGYSITPTGLGGGLTLPSIATTGVFTFDRSTNVMSPSSTTTYDFSANARSLAGPIGSPSAADYIILGDWTGQTPSTQTSFAGFAITHIALTGSGSTPSTQPAWQTGSTVNHTMRSTLCSPEDCIPMVDPSTIGTRLNSLGLSGTGTKVSFMAYGISPSVKLPGFVQGGAPDYLEQPVIIPFLTTTTIDSVITLADPMKGTPQLPFSRAFTARVAATRVVDGVTLSSSLQEITNSFTTQLLFEAPLAKSIKLDNTTDLASADLMLTASSQAKTLGWVDELGLSADDYAVTLFEIVAGTTTRLAPVRIYHVLTPSVTVDGSLLAPGHKYVFSITARKGLTKAKQGNYGADTVTYPFSEATTVSAVLTIQ
ncbi:MAG TPA: hypothetical protein VL326_18370 [Kofleriaceae bacterium]|jgi:hypothetical protein|nr:hypothetical protein [Kofleriaceae bacterium]